MRGCVAREGVTGCIVIVCAESSSKRVCCKSMTQVRHDMHHLGW